LPALGYAYDALEPVIDAHTLLRQHVIHHGNTVARLNGALLDEPALWDAPALWLLCNLDKVPKAIRLTVHQAAGGHVNRSMYWRTMKPGPAGAPAGLLGKAIARDFGSLSALKARFEAGAAKHTGAGWVWLTCSRDNRGALEVMTTTDCDHPMMVQRTPILLNHLWDHAHSPRDESDRAGYLRAWWSVVNWEQASRSFNAATQVNPSPWDAR